MSAATDLAGSPGSEAQVPGAAGVQFLASRQVLVSRLSGADIGKTRAALDTLGPLSCRSRLSLGELVRQRPSSARLPPRPHWLRSCCIWTTCTRPIRSAST